ncbi:MAG TPA: ComEC/Rec2 family competence protein [Candidatus Paceibacterota bacterium]|nr:ComEC/Rec2 family competence protein [Candidatus Paceibacterota bacterium]
MEPYIFFVLACGLALLGVRGPPTPSLHARGPLTPATSFALPRLSAREFQACLSVIFLCFGLGVLRFQFADKMFPAVFETMAETKIEITGTIIDEPDVRENNQKLTVEISKENQKTRILVNTGLEKYFHYGDEIFLAGKFEKPKNFLPKEDEPEAREFDYVSYLRKDGIGYMMNYPKIEITGKGKGNPIRGFLFSTKEKFVHNIAVTVRSPESLLLGGLILGERSSFDKEMRQKFIDTGTIHIVALSGYNVTIISEWIIKIFSFLPQAFALSFGILGIILFVTMTGGHATAVRAGIMAVLALIARATGRNYDVARGIVLAAVVMVLISPHVLVYDVSFQLSFIATIAVIFVSPKMEKYFLWIPAKWLRDITATTFSAYIFVLPFVLYKMGNLSLVALPANVLVLPTIPFTMVLGFMTGFAEIFSPILSAPFAYVAYLLLHYQLGVIDFFAKIPFSAFMVPSFSFVFVFLTYAIFAYLYFRKRS